MINSSGIIVKGLMFRIIHKYIIIYRLQNSSRINLQCLGQYPKSNDLS